MATLARVKVGIVGAGAIGGGSSTFYTSSSDPAVFHAALRVFWLACATHIAAGSTITFAGAGDTIDEATGEINGSWSGTPPANIITAGSSNWAAGVGCRVVWTTAGITRGRRVKGSTYVVPLGGNLYDGTGSIADGARSAIDAAAAVLRASDSGSMRIYTRPTTVEKPPGTFTDYVGKSQAVTGSTVPDVVSWLRSRRT